MDMLMTKQANYSALTPTTIERKPIKKLILRSKGPDILYNSRYHETVCLDFSNAGVLLWDNKDKKSLTRAFRTCDEFISILGTPKCAAVPMNEAPFYLYDTVLRITYNYCSGPKAICGHQIYLDVECMSRGLPTLEERLWGIADIVLNKYAIHAGSENRYMADVQISPTLFSYPVPIKEF